MGWLYISITTFQAINANQIFARQNILSERPDTTWAPPHIKKPVQFRKYLETIKFHEEAVVTRKTSQPHLFSTLTILYTVRNHFLSMCSLLFCISLLLLSSAIIPWCSSSLAAFLWYLGSLCPGNPRGSQGIRQYQSTPQDKNSICHITGLP